MCNLYHPSMICKDGIAQIVEGLKIKSGSIMYKVGGKM